MKTCISVTARIGRDDHCGRGHALPLDHDGLNDLHDLRGPRGKTDCRSSRSGSTTYTSCR